MNPMTTDLNNLSDHDLLIVLHEQVKGLRVDIQNLSTQNSETLDDHETRLRSIEQTKWSWTGAAGVIGAAVTLLINHYFN